MNVIYSDTMELKSLQLKRLLMVGRKITFTEREYFRFDGSSSITVFARHSPLKRIIGEMKTDFLDINYTSAIEIAKEFNGLHEVSSQYSATDLKNKRFISSILNAVVKGQVYSDVFEVTNNAAVVPYSVEQWIVENKDKILMYDLSKGFDLLKGMKKPFSKGNLHFETFEEGLFTFIHLVGELSIGVTTLLMGAGMKGKIPLSSNPLINVDNSL